MATSCFQAIAQDADGALGNVMKVCFDGNGKITEQKILTGDAAKALKTYLFGDLDTMWLLIAGALVFFMQLGFGMLEAGTVRSKNVSNILFKNIMDAGLGAICWFVIGYAVAYGGDDDGHFIGSTNFGLSESSDYASWFFQWAFAATAATIVSGSVAERIRVEAYFIYSVVITIFIYPVVAHWVWDTEGGLSAFNEDGVTYPAIDFAGSGVVHMVGGFSGLVGAYVVGPRIGRFDNANVGGGIRGHSVPFQVLGTLILWFGWYGFNCGSTLVVHGAMTTTASRVAVTTTLAAASGVLSAELITFFTTCPHSYDVSKACNGALAGLVSITAGCSVVSPGSAVVIGLIGGAIYVASSRFLEYLKIDDPLDAAPVHGFCGFWGVLAAGIFSTTEIIIEAQYNETIQGHSTGRRFLTQLIEGLCIMSWTVATSGVLFVAIDKTIGIRVSKELEMGGLDKTEHGGTAYTYSGDSQKTSPKKPSTNLHENGFVIRDSKIRSGSQPQFSSHNLDFGVDDGKL